MSKKKALHNPEAPVLCMKGKPMNISAWSSYFIDYICTITSLMVAGAGIP
jgi:hypothetical protein